MHHENTLDIRIPHAATPLLTGILVCVPAATAQANPLDEVRHAVTSSPMAFGLGCAAGAVLGGLTVGLVSSRSKKRARQELEDAVRAAERAEMAAQRAEHMLREQQAAMHRLEKDKRQEHAVTRKPQRTSVEVTPAPRHARATIAQTLPTIDEEQPATTVQTVVVSTKASDTGHKHETTRVTDKDVTAPLRARVTGEGVRSLLRQRLGAEAFDMDGVPVIGRGETRPASTSTFVVPRRPRNFDPQKRADFINKRVPRFDESLFPDTMSEAQGEMDVFETAMQAMDQTLSFEAMEEQVSIPASPTPQMGFSHPQGHPEVVDASSYIDYLVHDEMERNRTGSARRFSRAHLTMIEGTADLGAAKRSATYTPRHFAPASKEA